VVQNYLALSSGTMALITMTWPAMAASALVNGQAHLIANIFIRLPVPSVIRRPRVRQIFPIDASASSFVLGSR